jgi:TRAP-type C4-dicarboxylate transport system substrate-binding protein
MSTSLLRSRRRRALAVVASTTLLAALATGCASDDETSQAGSLDEMDSIVLKLSEFNPENGIFGQAWTAFEEEVEEKSDGKITFENYWSASLFGGPDSLAGVGDGVADLGTIIPSYFPTELPVTSWLSGLGNAASSSTAHAVAGGGAATYELALGNEAVTEEFAGHNLKVLTASASPPYNMLCTEPVDSESTASGKRARTSGNTWTATAEALGMTAVNIPLDELFESLQRGVVECSVQNPTGWVDFGLTDVATEYVPVTFAQMIPSTFVMNLDTWESLPLEAQQIIHDAMANATKFLWSRYMEREGEFGEFIADGGPIRVNDVSELDPIVEAQRADAVESMVDTAPAEVADPQAAVDEYLADLETWTAELVDNGYPVPERDPEAIIEAFKALAEVNLDEFYQTFQADVVQELRPE